MRDAVRRRRRIGLFALPTRRLQLRLLLDLHRVVVGGPLREGLRRDVGACDRAREYVGMAVLQDRTRLRGLVMGVEARLGLRSVLMLEMGQ